MTEFATIDLDNVSLLRLSEILTRIRMRGCGVEHWEPSDSTNGFHVTVSCRCGSCRLVWDDADRFSKDQSRPVYARDVLFNRRGRKLHLLNPKAPPSMHMWAPKDDGHGY